MDREFPTDAGSRIVRCPDSMLAFEAMGIGSASGAVRPGSAVVKRDLAALFIRLANKSAVSGELCRRYAT